MMKLSKYGGDKNGIGFYELMVVPRQVYQKAISAIKKNRIGDFYDILGVSPSRLPIHHVDSNRILIIEDKLELAKAVERALENRGFNVSYSAASKEGLEKVDRTEVNLLILDLTLPDTDALNICRILKENKHTSHIPIIIINGNNNEKDIIAGLKAGADDYIGKNFSLEELAARVKAVLRRTNFEESSNVSSTVFDIDEARRKIFYYGQPLDLSRYEYELLVTFIRRPGVVFTREKLMDMIWESPESSMDRTVDAHIKNIRIKLKSIQKEKDPIVTHRGTGYALREDL